MAGSLINDNAEARRFPMAADLAYRSYISSTLWDTFLKDIPNVVTQEHIIDLRKKDGWKIFIASCTGGEPADPFSDKSSGSNEEEFMQLVRSIVKLEGLEKYFKEPDINNPRQGRVRISHQGNQPMKTWNTNAKWLRGNYGSTARQKELKPDLMSTIVEDVGKRHPRKAQQNSVRFAIPQTILPPPNDWQPKKMKDKGFPIVKSKEPVWECLDLFWECKRNSQALKNGEVYIDCALKAAEALRYQWSRRYIYCFLQCGTMMRLLHFDRSGLMASTPIDITSHTGTVVLVRCLLAVFLHKPGRLGYPAGKDAPFHKYDPDNRLLQVVTVNKRQLYIDDQEAGPPRDHLVSRATVVFKAKLLEPNGKDKTGWDYCYKSSWAQKLRRHEGEYLEHLQDLPNVVDLLVYGVVKVEDDDDTTVFGRQCPSGAPMTLIEKYYERARKQKRDFNPHTGTAVSDQEDINAMLLDPRRPEGGSPQDCDDREHRDVVTDWVSFSFNEAASSLDSSHLPTIISIWQQAFSAIKSICDAGVLHRDISFRNIRIDDQHKIKVCDFDMAMILGSQSTGEKDRTGTIAFMATSILHPEQCIHRPVHDCESIFWLCALDLLCRVGIGATADDLANIMDSGRDIGTVRRAKNSVMARLSVVKRKTQHLKSPISLDDPKDSSLFFCLTALAREFFGNDYDMDYEGAEEGFEGVCFDRCIEIIGKEKP
jgi:serine/threonine protein kinase